MDGFDEQLNTLMMNTYNSLDKLEQAMLRASKNIHLSISEVHMLEAVVECAAGSGHDGASISELGEFLQISLPSVTAAINKLVHKGYVVKEKGFGDGRVVRVKLTRQGQRAERAHRYFHRKLVREVASSLTEDEKIAMIKGVGKLEEFLEMNIQKYKNT